MHLILYINITGADYIMNGLFMHLNGKGLLKKDTAELGYFELDDVCSNLKISTLRCVYTC